MSNYKFILSGGGTGGHIYPAIALANELKARFPQAEFLFVGAKGKMEMEKVPQAGYRIEGLWISGIQRKKLHKNLSFPFKLMSSLYKASRIVRRFKPDMVIGTGGFASGPLLRVAAAKGIPCAIQEQNAYPGITNRLLAKKVLKIFVAYDGLERFFPAPKLLKTGNPVRQDLLEIASKKDEGLQHFHLQENRPVLLVLGGSLGARRINQFVESRLDFFCKNNVQLLWQCGKGYYETYKKHESDSIRVCAFIDRMDWAYAAATLIISRAGAIAVSELCVVGKPVIFIPSPNVAEDHQTKNAQAIAVREAAVLLKESELEARFGEVFSDLLASGEKQEKLGKNIQALALPNATRQIVDELEILLKNRHPNRT